MAAGSWVMAKAGVEGRWLASSFANWAAPVPTWLPAASSTTMDQVMVLPPNGAVRFSAIGSDWVAPPVLRGPVTGDRAAAPSILASIRHDRAVTGQVAARGSGDTVTVAG